MPTMLEVMQGRLGIAEIRGPQHNAVIVGWSEAIGWPGIKTDEESWCSICACSAALEADLPMPPHNIRPMARGWLTWGVKAETPAPGDVAIWPRGDPKGPWGHVNIVEEVHADGSITCIGGNQATGKGYDAVTRVRYRPEAVRGALGFRRPVEATVQALRPHSGDIKKGDKVQNAGWLVTFIPAVLATIKEWLAPVRVPEFASLPDALTWWQTVLGGFNALGGLVMEHPWLAGTLVVGLVLVVAGHKIKAARVARHAAGVPIASQVAMAGA